jgi:hypothetical protein
MIKDDLTHSMEWRLEKFKNENIEHAQLIIILRKNSLTIDPNSTIL